MTKALHECPGCGERRRVRPGTYCRCNPRAPYRMVALTVLSSVAAVLGRKGGSATSEAKRRAARENGKRGGRPKGS